MSIERTRALLGGRREGVGNVMAAGLGVITPFCSCSAVPAFIGFVAAGVPIGVTLSFLIASPMVNEIAIGLLFTLFGWKITAIYIAAGLVIAIVAGWVLGRMHAERWVEPFVFETKLRGQVVEPGLLLFNLGCVGRQMCSPPLAIPRHHLPRPRRRPDRTNTNYREATAPKGKEGWLDENKERQQNDLDAAAADNEQPQQQPAPEEKSAFSLKSLLPNLGND